VTAKVIDFEASKEAQLLKRKEAKVDALRSAFRQARADTGPDKPKGRGKKRAKSRKK